MYTMRCNAEKLDLDNFFPFPLSLTLRQLSNDMSVRNASSKFQTSTKLEQDSLTTACYRFIYAAFLPTSVQTAIMYSFPSF